MNSSTAGATQRNPVYKNQNKGRVCVSQNVENLAVEKLEGSETTSTPPQNKEPRDTTQ